MCWVSLKLKGSMTYYRCVKIDWRGMEREQKSENFTYDH